MKVFMDIVWRKGRGDELLEEEGDTIFIRRSGSRQDSACLSPVRVFLPLLCHRNKYESATKLLPPPLPESDKCDLLFLVILMLTDLERKIFL